MCCCDIIVGFGVKEMIRPEVFVFVSMCLYLTFLADQNLSLDGVCDMAQDICSSLVKDQPPCPSTFLQSPK